MDNNLDSNEYITNIRCKVSSVLDNNTSENGKDYMFDDNEDTGWSSNQGSVQFILLCFDMKYNVSELMIRSQGGFCPKV
jgi:hypothetical protein